MHHFEYRQGRMHCEDVPLERIAQTVGTPFYLYSHATLTRHFKAFDAAFDGLVRTVCYSAKANTNQAVLRLFARLGSGLDIVSGGELYRGLKAGFAADKIVYSGVGKRADEIDFALKSGIRMFNSESLQELELIDRCAARLGLKAPVAVRVNPDVDPRTHPYISTGLKENKFGIDREGALAAYRAAKQMAHVEVVGIDCHIGSQIADAQPFEAALVSLMALVAELAASGIALKYIDMGGGLGITYDREAPPHPDVYARAIGAHLAGTSYELILEPGRVLVGNAGVLVTRVLYRKRTGTKEFVITDAGMNDLLRPALYKAFHAVKPVVDNGRGLLTADIVGPICESGDFTALGRDLPEPAPGDLLAVMSAGAYGFTMASNYCSRPRVAEVMVKGGRFEVVRRRETYADLVRGETLPSFLSS